MLWVCRWAPRATAPVVLPTAAPFMVPMDQKCLANCEAMYKTAHEYGRYE